jgi:UDP-N-acetylmuramoyl-tripeptide--D-alanyl-D-alanine ligase
MLTALSISLLSAATIIFFSHRLSCYLRHFQAGAYSKVRFKDWIVTNGVYDKKGSLIAAIAAVALALFRTDLVICSIICAIAAVALIGLSVWEKSVRKVGSLKLRPTKQAMAIYNLALGLYSIAFALVIVGSYKLGAGTEISHYWLVVIVAIQSSPVWLVLASIFV